MRCLSRFLMGRAEACGMKVNMKKQMILKESSVSCFADEIAVDIKTQLDVLNELGIRFIEFRSGDGMNVDEYTAVQAQDLNRRLAEHEIRVSALGSPIGKISVEEEFAPHLKKLAHLTELAHILETPYIRVFSFFIPEGKDPLDYRDEVFYRTNAMVELAEREGVILLHENEKGIYGDTAERCLDLMQNFYGYHYQCTFDFANFLQCGENTMCAYEMLKTYISYVHIKDAVKSTGQVVLAGEGDGQVEEILRLLDQEKYQGFLSLEPHLVDFEGLQNLEHDAKKRGRSDGKAAFCQAFQALERILY